MNQEQIQAIAQAVAVAVAQALSQFATPDHPTEREQELETENDRLRAENDRLDAELQAWRSWGKSMPSQMVQNFAPFGETQISETTPGRTCECTGTDRAIQTDTNGMSTNLPTSGVVPQDKGATTGIINTYRFYKAEDPEAEGIRNNQSVIAVYNEEFNSNFTTLSDAQMKKLLKLKAPNYG
jgi:hypothetical protein